MNGQIIYIYLMEFKKNNIGSLGGYQQGRGEYDPPPGYLHLALTRLYNVGRLNIYFMFFILMLIIFFIFTSS